MGDLIRTGAGVGASGIGEEIVYSNKSSPSLGLVTGEEKENRKVSKNVTLVDTRHKVTLKSGTITSIPFLNTRISHKDTL